MPKVKNRVSKGRPRGSGTQGELAAAIAEVLRSRPRRDWTVEQLAVELNRRRLIPGKVYESAIWTAIKKHLRSTLRSAVRNVGTEKHPHWVRRFGCYVVKEQTEGGTEKSVYYWREWELMNRNQMVRALAVLWKHTRAMQKEADKVHRYCNRLLRNRGGKPIGRRELPLQD